MEDLERIEKILNYLKRRIEGSTIPGNEIPPEAQFMYEHARQFWAHQKEEVLRDKKTKSYFSSEYLLGHLG